MTDAVKQQFNVYLPPELIRRVKHAAIDTGQSLSTMVEGVLTEFADRHEGRSRRPAKSRGAAGRGRP